MNKLRTLLKSLVVLMAVMHGTTAKATHILGGNIGYTYLGETAPGSQMYRYRITMQFYLNCGADSNWPDLGSLLNTNGGNLPVGVYIQDPAAPNANKQRYTTVNLTLADSALITPELPNGCNLGTGLCTKLGILTGLVDLPLNFGGYHLYFQMNARNITILNLLDPNNTGIGFYAFIPPPLLNNSSPTWLGSPTPMLCINDTSTFINSATDPDGDQLIFSFVTPYGSVGAGGGIIQPPNVLPNTIPPVNYLPGFSVAQPFGAGGYSYINGATGLTRYLPPQQGNYVVAVEVREYRSGVLIGITRRDLQLQAEVCPPNDPPVALGTHPPSYTVQAGTNICFNLGFQDPNGDSLNLTASGTIFDGSLYNPPATITAPISGTGTVTTNFCWNTDCSEAQTQPYLFSVSVSDNGCPPRTLDVVYQVNVQGFAGPSAITGPTQVCPNQPAVAYSTTAIDSVTYNWSVNGGTVVSGQGSHAIMVQWGSSGTGTVSVVATNPNGCAGDTVALQVTIEPPTTASAGADQVVCPGTQVTIGGSPTGTAGSIFNWTPASGLSNASAANPTTTPSATTDYVVHVTTNGCTNSDTVRVLVSQPQVNAGADAAICAGASTQINAVGQGSVTWTPSTGLSSTTIHNPLANPTTTTTYAATLTDSIGCVAVDSVTVTVHALPIASAGPDLTPCANTTVNLGGSPTGPAGSLFAWSPSTGLNDASAANPVLSVTGSGTWTVTVTNADQCTASDAMTVTVLPRPTVDAGPDFTVCSGDSVQLQGSGSGALLWTPAFGLSDPTIPDPYCLPEATITYTLTATGVYACTNSDQTTVTVQVLPNANAGPDRTVCSGDSVQIGTSGPGTFTWSPSTGLSSVNMAAPLAAPMSTTTYVVTLSDSLTCSARDSVVVTVLPHPSAGSNGTLSICESGTPTDLFTSLGGTPEAGGQWLAPGNSPHGEELDPATDPFGPYTYVVGTGSQCADSATVAVIIRSPDVHVTGPSSLCLGDSVQVTASGGVHYAWTPVNDVSDPAIPSPYFAPSTTSSYTVLVTDTAGCTATGQITLTVLPLPVVNAGADMSICAGSGTPIGGSPTSTTPATYTWFPFDGLDNTAAANPVASPAQTTIYVVLVQDSGSGCAAMDSVTVSVEPLPVLDGGPDTAFCAGGSVQLGAIGAGTFIWSPATGLNDPAIPDPVASPDATTTYTVALTDANGCTTDTTVTVTVEPLPQVDAGPDPWLCIGSSVMLNGSGGPGTFSWIPAASVDDPSSATPMVDPLVTTTYTLMVTDVNHCTASDSVRVTVGTDPPIDPGQAQQTCAGTPVTLGGSPTSVPGSSYLWSPTAGLNDPTAPDPSASPATTTTYTLTVTNDTCTSTATVMVNVNSQGHAGFTWRSELGCEMLHTFLTDTSTGAVAWHWTLGDGTTSNDRDPQAFIPYGQNTLVTLIITDASGCTDSIAHLFTPETYNELVQLDVPNIFTPNGDGKNDLFTLGTDAILGSCASLRVMNRWGQTVFQSFGNDLSWDGRTPVGQPAPEGTYFYEVSVKDVVLRGNVMLTR